MQRPRGQGRGCTPPPSPQRPPCHAMPAADTHDAAAPQLRAATAWLGSGAGSARARAMQCDHQKLQRGGPAATFPDHRRRRQDRRRPVTAGLGNMAAVWPCVKSLIGGACVISPGMSGLCSPEAETASSWSTWTGRPRSGVRVVIGRCACLLTAGFCRGKASICEGLDTRVSTPAWRFGHIEVTPSSRLSRFPCIADVCTECCGYVH